MTNATNTFADDIGDIANPLGPAGFAALRKLLSEARPGLHVEQMSNYGVLFRLTAELLLQVEAREAESRVLRNRLRAARRIV